MSEVAVLIHRKVSLHRVRAFMRRMFILFDINTTININIL